MTTTLPPTQIETNLPGDPPWLRWMTDWNEGLGVVYERFMLNNYFDSLLARHNITSVLEAPIYGMAGVSGINSVRWAQRGCNVTLVDTDRQRLEGVEKLWAELNLPVTTRYIPAIGEERLPWDDQSFDFVWNFAALWYLQPAHSVEFLLRDLVRLSKRWIFISMPNSVQVGYLMRKYLIDKEFFKGVDESWIDLGRVKRALSAAGVRIVDEGVLDVPPWPDTCMPAAEVLRRLGIRSAALEKRFSAQDDGSGWTWNTMDYYLGRDPGLKERVERFGMLDRAPLPWQLKLVWAHHHYVLGERL